MLQDFIPPSSFLRNTFFVDLSLGDRVFYTRSNSVRVSATVVGMAGDGLIHLEYYHNPPPPVRESRISRTAPNIGPYSGFSEP